MRKTGAKVKIGHKPTSGAPLHVGGVERRQINHVSRLSRACLLDGVLPNATATPIMTEAESKTTTCVLLTPLFDVIAKDPIRIIVDNIGMAEPISPKVVPDARCKAISQSIYPPAQGPSTLTI